MSSAVTALNCRRNESMPSVTARSSTPSIMKIFWRARTCSAASAGTGVCAIDVDAPRRRPRPTTTTFTTFALQDGPDRPPLHALLRTLRDPDQIVQVLPLPLNLDAGGAF